MPVLFVLSLLACAPENVVSGDRSEAAANSAMASMMPLRLIGAPDTVRVGTTFEIRIADEAIEYARRRRRFTSSAVTWNVSDAQVAALLTDGANPARVRVTFLRSDSVTVAVNWAGRSGTWRGAPPASVVDTTDTPDRGSDGQLPLPADSPAELPRDSVVLPTSEGTGLVRRVRSGQSLQAAIDAARYGDVILLEAGARFVGPIQLRRKTGTGWITIRTDATPTTSGHRVSLADTARFARIEAPATGNLQAMTTEAGASGYWIVNVDIARSAGPDRLSNLVALGDGGSAQTTLISVPSRLVLDRVIVRGRPGLTLRRCISLQSAYTAIVNSLVIDCHEKGADSQAIGGWNGPGPFLIRNNRLEGAGENVMFGGDDPRIPGLNPSDIIIESNHFTKPISWFTSGSWTVKNLLEFKQGKRVLIRGNLFENNWPDGQTGVAILLKSVNQGGGAPWAETSDVSFVENIVRNSSAGITLAARPESHPAVPMSKVLISRNIVYRLGAESGFPAATERAILVMGGVAHLHIDGNTISAPASTILMARDGEPPRVPNFSFRRNLARFGALGIHGGGVGRASFDARYLTVLFSENCLFGAPASSSSGYIPGAILVGSGEATQLPGLASGSFAPAENSPCRAVTAGPPPGAPAMTLERHLARALIGR